MSTYNCRHASHASARWRTLLLVSVLLAPHLAACGGGDAGPDAGDATPSGPDVLCSDDPPGTFSVALRVVDEQGAAVAGATVDTGAGIHVTDDLGQAALCSLSEPLVVIIDRAGLLAEPIVVGHSDANEIVDVRLLSDRDGARWVMHSGGDVMLGRRYEMPSEGAPLIPEDDPAGGARRVVEAVARAFAAADLRTLNLETVVSDLPESAAYPNKRVVIKSRPETLAALQALGTDVAILGNNHIRDYFDVGVTHTMSALEALGIAHVGASDGPGPANEPLILDIGGVRMGILSWTTLDGSSINNGYARDGDPIPPNLSPSDEWQYEGRTWGFQGASWSVPTISRRIGTVWDLFVEAEPIMTEQEIAAAWASIAAVYPEMQDWVARRGHGGAAYWVTTQARQDIAALAERVDVVMVQVHAGHEYQDAPSGFATRVARAAIDAGAHIVIAHHPHVLQGLEWYGDGFIAYSLGNFVFDQNHFLTFRSAFLRTVWDGAQLIEARLVPLELDRYQPKPAADAAARRNALALWEKSILAALSDRDADRELRIFAAERDPATRQAHVRMRNHDAVITDVAPAEETLDIEVPAGATVPIGYAGLIHARAGGADVLLGRDLFGWGSFEDLLVDGVHTGDAYWRIDAPSASIQITQDSGAGQSHASLQRVESDRSDAFARTLARIPLPEHRLYDGEPGGVAVPADGAASYSMRFLARLQGSGTPYVRLDFTPTDGASGPTGGVQRQLDLPIEIPADGRWHTVELLVPGDALIVDGNRMGAVLPHVRLGPPAEGESELAIDELQFIEWRPATSAPDRFGAYELVRNERTSATAARLRAMPLHDR